MQQLNWARKEKDEDGEHPTSKIDEKNLDLLRKKQEILAKYNKMSKENGPGVMEEGVYKYVMVKGNNSSLVKRVLKTREYWQELE